MTVPSPASRNHFFRLSLVVLTTAGIGYFLFQEKDQLIGAALRLSATSLSLTLFTVFVQWVFRTSRDLIFLRSLGYTSISWVELFLLNNLQMAANHLPMRAGTLLSAGILKTRHKVSYKHFAGLFASQQLLILIPVSLLSALIIGLHPHNNPRDGLIASTIAIALSAGIVVCLYLPVSRVPVLPASIAKALGQIQSATIRMLGQSKLMTLMLLCSAGIFFASAARIYLIYHLVLDAPITAGGALVVATMIHLSLFVAITPAGLGIREALVGVGSSLVSIAAPIGVLASLIERVIVIIGIVIVFACGKILRSSSKLR